MMPGQDNSDFFNFNCAELVINDIEEAIKRIKKIEFLPDKVLIYLVDKHRAVSASVRVLEIIVVGEDNIFTPKVGLDELADEDEERAILEIPIPNVKKILLFDASGREVRFSK
jgi:hypothetical protein